MAYASVNDVQARMMRMMESEERAACAALLCDAAVIIDSFAPDATADQKRVVSCRMVARAIGDGGSGSGPIGATQGQMSALGYQQSWTFSNGALGELYLAKMDKQLLGKSNQIGSRSPVENLAAEVTPA